MHSWNAISKCKSPLLFGSVFTINKWCSNKCKLPYLWPMTAAGWLLLLFKEKWGTGDSRSPFVLLATAVCNVLFSEQQHTYTHTHARTERRGERKKIRLRSGWRREGNWSVKVTIWAATDARHERRATATTSPLLNNVLRVAVCVLVFLGTRHYSFWQKDFIEISSLHVFGTLFAKS